MMLSNEGFDLWADGYEQSVLRSDEENSYPFAGYHHVLNTIYRRIRAHEGRKVMDLGFGTGVLSHRLYQDGYEVYGADFSEKMLQLAQQKMPGAHLILHDFSTGLPEIWRNQRFDHIVCTYAIHHLDDAQKISLIKQAADRLLPGGLLQIGDVSFRTQKQLIQCRNQFSDLWDDEELYPVYESLHSFFPTMRFETISLCAGILTLPANP